MFKFWNTSGAYELLPTNIQQFHQSAPKRTRYLAYGGIVAVVLLILFAVTHPSSLSNPSWRSSYGHYFGASATGSETSPTTYASWRDLPPIDPDNLLMTEEQCDAAFPGLWEDLERSKKYYEERGGYTHEYMEKMCDDGIWTHARVVIYNNRLYLKYYQQSVFTRSNAALALLAQSVLTAPEKLPNVEFCIGVNDWGSTGKFSLDRAPYLLDVWLMPDYGFYAWPEPGVGSYDELRVKTERLENQIGWEGKTNTLYWRGAVDVGSEDRKYFLNATHGKPWADAKPLVWSTNEGYTPMEDHCKWKFHGYPEGETYSGRLKYLQNCRSVIVTHPPHWIQHWTHLYNGDPNSLDQNIVILPTDSDRLEDGWNHLSEVMDDLIANDWKAKKVADNSWDFFRNRYVSPASAACYWRKALKKFSEVQTYNVNYTDDLTSWPTFELLGWKLKQEVPIH